MRDACRALGLPVVGGNVSLYNESAGGPIYPTPVVGMVGERARPGASCRRHASPSGHAVALVGPFEPALGAPSSRSCAATAADPLPALDLAEHAEALAVVRDAVRRGDAQGRARRLRGRPRRRARRVLLGAASARASSSTAPPSDVRRGPGRRRDRRAARAVERCRARGDRRGRRRRARGRRRVQRAARALREACEGAIPAAFGTDWGQLSPSPDPLVRWLSRLPASWYPQRVQREPSRNESLRDPPSTS